MTIFEVMYTFLEYAFPEAIITQFQNHIDVTAFLMTYMVIFGLILMPLWNLATYFLRRSK